MLQLLITVVPCLVSHEILCKLANLGWVCISELHYGLGNIVNSVMAYLASNVLESTRSKT